MGVTQSAEARPVSAWPGTRMMGIVSRSSSLGFRVKERQCGRLPRRALDATETSPAAQARTPSMAERGAGNSRPPGRVEPSPRRGDAARARPVWHEVGGYAAVRLSLPSNSSIDSSPHRPGIQVDLTLSSSSPPSGSSACGNSPAL